MIGIIDYGLGNLRSILNILSKNQKDAKIICHPEDLQSVSKIILPGVGSFDHGIRHLHKGNWIRTLNQHVIKGKKPILGICLGMHLMCNSSEEGKTSGLCWIDARVKKLKFTPETKLKVPHMGWNTVEITRQNDIIQQGEREQRFYFVHSYHVICNNEENIIANSSYGQKIVAAFNKNHIYGVQFHPEKSHQFGMNLMVNFADL